MFNLPRLGKRIEEILGGFGNQVNRTIGGLGQQANNVGNQAQRGINQIQQQATNAARQNVNVINRQVQQVQRQVPQVDFTQLSRNIANAANPVNQVKYQLDAVNKNVLQPLNTYNDQTAMKQYGINQQQLNELKTKSVLDKAKFAVNRPLELNKQNPMMGIIGSPLNPTQAAFQAQNNSPINLPKVDLTKKVDEISAGYKDTALAKTPYVGDAVGFAGENIVNPIAKSFARYGDVTQGQQRYSDGSKGLAEGATDTFNIASMAYTPLKAGKLAQGGKVALKAVPGAFARGAGAGAGTSALNQYADTGKVDPMTTLMSAGIGGVANVGLPYAGGLLKRGGKQAIAMEKARIASGEMPGGFAKLPGGNQADDLFKEARKYKSAADYQYTTGDPKIDAQIKQVAEMSPDEYLKQAFEATDGKLGGSYDSWLKSNAQDAMVAKRYAEAMQNGDKFPIAYIDKAMGSQDGRNRALAAKLAGRDKMPVGIIPEMTTAEKIAFAEAQIKKYPEKSYLGNKYRRELTDLYNQATKPPKAYYQNVPKSYTGDPLEALKAEARQATGARSDYSPENLQANRQIRAKNASSITYADKKAIKPDELVTVYRAVPGKAKGGLTEGDWVTPNKEQARLFMKQSWAQDDTGAKIVTKKVKASELRYHADDAKGYVDDELLYVPKSDPLEALKQEARKYKSADEFVKAQGEPLYHGTKSDFAQFDNAKMGSQTDSGMYGKGFYLTPNQKSAKHYAGEKGYIKEVYADMKNPYVINTQADIPDIKVPNKTLEDMRNGPENYSRAFTKYLKDKGYDGVIDNLGVADNQRVVFDANQLKTKQQLTDLYNQATKGVESKGKPKVELKQPDVPVKTGVDRVKEIIGETPQVRNARMVRNEAVTLGKTIEPLISQETKLAKVARKYQSELNKLVKLKPSPRVNNKIALRSTKLQSVLGELEQVTPQVKTLKNQRRALAREATGLKGSTPDMTPEQRAKNVELENRRREILGLEQLAEADVGGNVGGLVAKSQGLQDRIAGGMRTLETKEGVVPRTVAKGVRTLVGTSGKSSDQMFQTKKLRSSISNLTEDLNNEYKMLTDGYSKESLQRVAWKLDPAVAKQKNVKLNEQEQILATKLRELADIEHTQAYLSGSITKEQYEKGLGKYLTRAYESKEFGTPDELDALAQWSGYKTDSSLSKRRKNVSEGMVEDQFDDPAFKLMKQRQFTETNRIVGDYQQWLSKSGMAIDDARPGYSRLPESEGWGDMAGKYVPNSVFEDITGFHFGNQAAQSLYNLAGQWERLGPRRWRKMALTIMNPAVRFINKEFNSALAFGGGVNNLVEYRVGLSRAIKDIKVGTKGDIGTMKRLGLFSGNITREEMMQTVKQLKANGKTNAAVELIKKLGDSYGRVDDAGKVAYVRYMMKNKGLSMESAVKQAQRYFQDYSSVGLLWDISAKTPIAGKPFGRFLGDFMFRILPNSIQDRPMRAIGLLGAMYGLQHIASTASGETAEDRKTRENRIGAGKVPILGMSTEFQTPWGAVDIRRLIGVSGAVSSGESGQPGIAEIMPFQSDPIMTNQYTGERELNPNFVGSDPLIGPAIQAAMDRDFRGKPIADPNAAGTDKFSGVAESAQPEGEGRNNTLNFLRTAYAPSYVNEMENLANTIQGKPTIYGSKRTPGQQLTRMTVGVRTEQFGPKEAQERRETQKWLTEKKELDDIIKGMPKAKQEAFKRVSGYYKLREKVPNEFEPGTDRWKKAPVFNFSEDKWKEYTSNPELYDVMVAQKEKERLRSIEENKKDPNIKVKPIQPEFDKRLSGGFRKQLINNKSLAPGEDVEADERMYSHSEWDAYQKIKEEYKKAAAAYYPKSDDEFVDEMVKHKQADFPKKGAAKQKYDDAYALYAAGQGSKPAYNDAVNADKEAYNEAKRTWTNNERKARGLDPISREMWDNVTFGYESDEEKVYKELKYGKGYGGYSKYSKGGGSGGGSGSDGFNPYKYNVSMKTGKINKPTVKMLASGAKISAVKSGTPKVSIKKSKV